MNARITLPALGLLLVGCYGEPKVLEPRSPPPRQAPPVAVPGTPIPEGYGRVVLNGTDGPLKITARADQSFVPPGHPVPPNRTGELCVTPCVVDLPVGRYELYMTSADGTYARGDTDTLNVTEGLTQYERAPGKYVQPDWIPIAPTAVVILGALAALGGAGLVSSSESDSTRVAGGALLAGGVVTVGFGGVWLYDAKRGAIQAGATTQWTLPRTPPNPGGEP